MMYDFYTSSPMIMKPLPHEIAWKVVALNLTHRFNFVKIVNDVAIKSLPTHFIASHGVSVVYCYNEKRAR